MRGKGCEREGGGVGIERPSSDIPRSIKVSSTAVNGHLAT